MEEHCAGSGIEDMRVVRVGKDILPGKGCDRVGLTHILYIGHYIIWKGQI